MVLYFHSEVHLNICIHPLFVAFEASSLFSSSCFEIDPRANEQDIFAEMRFSLLIFILEHRCTVRHRLRLNGEIMMKQ